VDSLEDKVFELEEVHQKTSCLRETAHAQEEQFESLSASKAELENMISCKDPPSAVRPTPHDLVAAEKADRARGIKLIELTEEKKLLAWQQTHLLVQAQIQILKYSIELGNREKNKNLIFQNMLLKK
jgi:hypothetical protein